MKILITGSSGLVGSAIREVSKNSKHEFVFATRKDADLTIEQEVIDLYAKTMPAYVIHTAAFVGGVGGNLKYPAHFFRKNILMNTHMLHWGQHYKVKKFLAFSSVCVFPDGIPILKESEMHKGEPFDGNFAYAYAKRMVDVEITAMKRQYGISNYSSIFPGNIFGKNDLYNLEIGHVLPSLIHKLYLAKKENKPFKIWGNGSASREFLYSEDLARMLLKIIDMEDIPSRIIISGDKQFTIKQVVEMLCEVSEFKGEVIWETDKPNGQKSRPTDLSVLKSLFGEVEYTDIKSALRESYNWFANNYPKVRL